MKKRGVSAVIATVLLILLTVAAVALIAGIIIPFVKNELDKSKKCFSINEQISVVQGNFTCYTLSSTKIMIKRTSKDFLLQGFMISISSGGSSKVYKIEDNIKTSGVKMHDNNETLRIPKAGEAETYVFSLSGNYASISPVIEGNLPCKEISEQIYPC